MAEALDADVIIIGSGAGGGTLARALAPSGVSILVLERGDYLPHVAYPWPPFAHEPYIAEVAQRLQELGLHPFALPLANGSDQLGRNHTQNG